jgi:hypothetical protein
LTAAIAAASMSSALIILMFAGVAALLPSPWLVVIKLASSSQPLLEESA